MTKILKAGSLAGYEPEIGRWLWAMEEVRRRTLRLAQGLDQRTLDWEGQDGQDNSIGSLLYHIGLVEVSWLFLDILGQAFPVDIVAAFPYKMATDGRITPVRSEPLAAHLERLNVSRAVFLKMLKDISTSDWDRLRSPQDEDYEVTPAWAIFHLLEHEAGHASQISALKARASRILESGKVL